MITPALTSKPPPGGGAQLRVLVVYERGSSGSEALRQAAELASVGAELSVVTLAPQAKPSKCCGGGGAGPYNCALRDEARDELRQARESLGAAAEQASFTALLGTPSVPLADWASSRRFDLILLPGHRLTRGGNRYAGSLRRSTTAEVRLT